MTLLHVYNGTPIVNLVKLQDELSGYSASAQLGTPDIVRVIVDDPTAAYDFIAYKRWQMIEDANPAGDQTVWRGWVGEQIIGRSPATLTTTARQWELELIEDNTILVRRVLGWLSEDTPDTTANRPSETVSARITWLLTTPPLTGIVVDHGLVQASTVVLDPTDYLNRTPADVLQDCALASGLNYHVRFRESSNDLELIFFDFLVSGLDLASIAISNALADVDSAVTFAPFREGKLHRRASRIASGVALPFSGGTVYRTEAATASTYAAVDHVAPTANVETAATATTLADRLLVQQSIQEEEGTGVVLLLPDDQLNDVKVGQRLDVKMTHWPGWTTARPARVTQRTFARPSNMSQDVYEVTLDLKPALVTVATDARIIRSRKPDSVDQGGGLFLVGYPYDGDAPPPGASSFPLVGKIAYNGAAGARFGLDVTGGGLLAVELRITCVVTGGPGSMTNTVYIRKNGVTVATDSHTTTGGIRAMSSSWLPGGFRPELTATIPVLSGDLIEAYLQFDPTAYAASPGTTSIGDLGSLGAHYLRASGNLS